MALYWPNQHVALEVVDDPLAKPFDRATDPHATVVQTTVAEISNLSSLRKLARHLADLFGRHAPEDTPSLSRHRQNRLHASLFTWAQQHY